MYWGEKEEKKRWRVNEKKMRLIERIRKQDEIRLEIKLNSAFERKKERKKERKDRNKVRKWNKFKSNVIKEGEAIESVYSAVLSLIPEKKTIVKRITDDVEARLTV